MHSTSPLFRTLVIGVAGLISTLTATAQATYYATTNPADLNPTGLAQLALNGRYCCNTREKFDHFMRLIPQGASATQRTTVDLGEAEFQTAGIWILNRTAAHDTYPIGFRLKNNIIVKGASRGKTTVKLVRIPYLDVPATNTVPDYRYNRVFSSGEPPHNYVSNSQSPSAEAIAADQGQNITIRDLKIDCNFAGLYSQMTGRPNPSNMALTAIALWGTNFDVNNVDVVGAAGRMSTEAFAIYFGKRTTAGLSPVPNVHGDQVAAPQIYISSYYVYNTTVSNFGGAGIGGGYVNGIAFAPGDAAYQYFRGGNPINANLAGLRCQGYIQGCTLDFGINRNTADSNIYFGYNIVGSASWNNAVQLIGSHVYGANRGLNNDSNPENAGLSVSSCVFQVPNSAYGIHMNNSLNSQIINSTFVVRGPGSQAILVTGMTKWTGADSTGFTWSENIKIEGNTISLAAGGNPSGVIGLNFDACFAPACVGGVWTSGYRNTPKSMVVRFNQIDYRFQNYLSQVNKGFFYGNTPLVGTPLNANYSQNSTCSSSYTTSGFFNSPDGLWTLKTFSSRPCGP